MTEKTFLILLVALVSLDIAFADCSEQRACQNQDNMFYCSPGDTTCDYKVFVQGGLMSCVVDSSFNDIDTDQDKWSDNCDALPGDILEWFDMDGDGFGHNYDCNDFNRSIGVDCDPDGDGNTNEQEYNDGSDPNSNSNNGGGGSNTLTICVGYWDCTPWTQCTDGAKTRICTNKNSCLNNKPEEWEGCPNYVTLKTAPKQANQPTIIEPQVQIVDKEILPPEDKDGNRVTGQVFNTEPGFMQSGLWLLLLIILAIIGVYIWKKGKDN